MPNCSARWIPVPRSLKCKSRNCNAHGRYSNRFSPRRFPNCPDSRLRELAPARAVSGDYYDVFKLGSHKLGICVADVVGKECRLHC